MMKKLISILAVCSLAACSSSSKRDTLAPKSSATNEDSSYESGYDVKDDVSELVGKDKVVAQTAPASYQSLNEAIKTQNDERIYTTSSQILTQNPTDLKALNAMAMYNYKKGRFDVARFLLVKGIARHPESHELHSNLGIVFLAQNERREAIKEFRKAISINGSDQVASANLGAIYVAEKDYIKGEIALEAAYGRGMRDAKILNNYGIALAATGKYERAAEIYKAALKEQSTQKEVLLNYAILLIDNMNKFPEGLEILNRLKFVGSSSESRNRIIALENKAKAGVK